MTSAPFEVLTSDALLGHDLEKFNLFYIDIFCAKCKKYLPPNEFSTPAPPLPPVFAGGIDAGGTDAGVIVKLVFCERVRKSRAAVSAVERSAGSLSGTTLRSTTSSTSMSII